MAASALHIFRRRDLRAGLRYDGLDDPDQIAPVPPVKARTLLGNPAAGDEDEPVQIVGTEDNRVIGRLDLVPGLVRVGGETQRIHWGSDFFVAPASRRSLMGVTLVMKSQQLCAAVGASGPSQAALPLYQKLKYIDLPLPRYIMLRRSRAVVEKFIGGGVGGTAVTALADAALATHRGVVSALRAARTRGLRVEKVDRMPERLDPLLAARPQGAATYRSAAWVNWLLTHAFKEDPRNASSLYLVRDPRDEPVAYFMTKVRFHESATHRQFRNVLLGSLQDWMIFEPSRVGLHQLVLLAARELVAAGADAVEVCTDDPAARGTLRLLGFRRVGAMHMMVRPGPTSPLARPEFRDPAAWWIRPGDGDTFFV